MPFRLRPAFGRCPVTPSVAHQLEQLSCSYSSSWFIAAPKHNHYALCCRRHSACPHDSRMSTASGSVQAQQSSGRPQSQHGFRASFVPPSSSRNLVVSSASTASDTATTVPRILSPTLPTDSPSFSLKKWLSHKLGYGKYRSIIRLYASLSEQAHSPSFAHSNTTAIPACPSTACALLTLHMWVLNSRLRGMAHDAWQNGREADAKRLHANIRLLFNLTWQEMEHTLVDGGDEEKEAVDSGLPTHYTANDYQQLSYGAMVSYDRAWSQYRETGRRSDLMGALWRNVWTSATPLHTAHLHSLVTYVEQAVQLSNRWTEHDIAISGAVHWPTLQVDQQSGASELLMYDAELYDGSRVRIEESVGVPMRLWESAEDDLLLVDTRKSRKKLEGEARKMQQLPAAGEGTNDVNGSKR